MMRTIDRGTRAGVGNRSRRSRSTGVAKGRALPESGRDRMVATHPDLLLPVQTALLDIPRTRFRARRRGALFRPSSWTSKIELNGRRTILRWFIHFRTSIEPQLAARIVGSRNPWYACKFIERTISISTDARPMTTAAGRGDSRGPPRRRMAVATHRRYARLPSTLQERMHALGGVLRPRQSLPRTRFANHLNGRRESYLARRPTISSRHDRDTMLLWLSATTPSSWTSKIAATISMP